MARLLLHMCVCVGVAGTSGEAHCGKEEERGEGLGDKLWVASNKAHSSYNLKQQD